jgi:GxxExxY protein
MFSMEILFKELSYAVVGAAMEVHRLLGPGFLEIVYAEALAMEFNLRDVSFRRQVEIPVEYKRKLIGSYKADFLVEKEIILELKAGSCLNAAHFAQAQHYLAATGLRLAILINFGALSLEFKRIVR